MFKCIDLYLDKTTLFGNIVFMSFILPLIIFTLFYYKGFDVVNSVVAVSTLSMALTAIFTVLFTFSKEKKV